MAGRLASPVPLDVSYSPKRLAANKKQHLETNPMKTLTLFAVLWFAATTTLRADTFVYVSVAGEKKIAIFKQTPGTGALSHCRDVSVGGSPGSLAVDPKRQFLFAALRSTREIASFRIDPQTGKLLPIWTVSAGGNPAYVVTDRSGRFILSAYYGEGKVAVHRIRTNGLLNAEALQSISTDKKAHAILADPSNRFVFVPHTGPNAIFQFAFDEKTGKLTANTVPKVVTGEGTGPRHIWFHPSRPFAYADNEQGSSVTAYRLNESTGTLTAFQTLSTLPEDFERKNTCADIEVTPSGRFVYASNRGHDSIAGFSIDARTGKLTPIGQAPTEKTPRSFNIDPAGNFLYAAGQASVNLAAYRIDTQTGRLNRFATYTVGKQPSWVQVVKMPD